MQILLRKDVEKLGHLGDVVEVADGYARNYLLPKGIGVLVTPQNMREVEAARQARRVRSEEELARVSRQAEMLEGFLCYITARATDKGHLFGSVGPQQVAEQLVENGFEGIRASNVSLERPLDQVGDYQVEIMLHPEVRARILLRVAAEEEEEEE